MHVLTTMTRVEILSAEDFPGPLWGILLPISFLAIFILRDLLAAVPLPPTIRTIKEGLISPFRNFITSEDVIEPTSSKFIASVAKTRMLSCLACIASVGWFGRLLYGVVVTEAVIVLQALVLVAPWAYISVHVLACPPVTPPYLFIAFAFCQFLLQLVQLGFDLSEQELHAQISLHLFQGFVPALFVWLAGTLPIQSVLVATNVARRENGSSNKFSCPEDVVTLWSWSTFSFVQPIFDLATKRTLNDTDVWLLSPYFQHKNIFRKCLEYRRLHPDHSLLRFLLVSNSLDLILDVVLEMWSAVVGFLPPYALQEILKALADTDNLKARNTAYFWTLATFVAHLSFAQVDLFQGWHVRRCYERTRGQLFCSLHYKSLVRHDASGQVNKEDDEQKSADLGRIVNLMQGDTYAVAQRFWEFSALFVSPIRLTIALVFLYRVLGWSALSGVAVIILAYLLNYPLATYNVYLTRSSWKAKDARMNVVNEMLQNIRFLKVYGWETYWAKKSQDARETELRWRVKQNVIDTLVSFIWTWIPSATALTSFLCYTLIAGQRLTVSKAFTAIALFTQLQEPMTALPGQIFAMLHAYVSMQRIEAFLVEREVPEWATTLKGNEAPDDDQDLGFCEANFRWPSAPKESRLPNVFQLGPLNIRFPPGKITLVSGATGSGKSALLAALLGEMECLSGKVNISKRHQRVAYCGQTPWLEHATIRDNIIFGCSYGFDQARYNAILDACALRKDLESLDAGDLTEIGEKGITLSGGQRARVALARAFYSAANCILLDDPLAAVDMHTAQHIVDMCLRGPLAKGRTIVLITHHVKLCLPLAAYVIELASGNVVAQGSPEELDKSGLLEVVIKVEDDPNTFGEDSGGPCTDPAPSDATGTLLKGGDGRLIEEETRAEGRVSIDTYITYIRAAGTIPWVLTVALMLMIRFINIGNQIYLARWGEAYEESDSKLLWVRAISKCPWTNLPSPNVDVKPWLLIYLYISLAGATSVFIYIGIGYYASLQAARALFNRLLLRLSRAPIRFFDVTPIGRILNRFTTDIGTIDGALMNSARACISGILNFLASFIVILVVVPSFAPFALFIAWLYIRLAPPYVQAARDLRRLESISLSPAFAGFDELLRGITHVRAFGMETRYQDGFYAKVDKFQSFDHVYWLVNGWLRWRYDCLGSVVVFAATMFALWSGTKDGSTAIVIVQAGIFAEASRQLVRVAAQLELDFNSVERVVEYLSVPQEAPSVIKERRPPAYWPSSSGQLQVTNLVVRYAPHLPAALQGISFSLRPSEKIGIVGRTGSGKSTLAMSLLRIIEPTSGSIIIDGLDVATLGLEDLRTRVTIISQDVAIFSGTIRSNLDPFNVYSDQECLDVLERCHILSLLRCESGQAPLDMLVSAGSLSAGERQLVAIARAILRRTNVIILDEATSQIDTNLDDKIQKTIREEFSHAIVITIAHRLKTIIDYDRVLMLEDGIVVQFGKPDELLTEPGPFRDLCRKSVDWSHLVGRSS